jgi:hypothetical protein
VDKLPVLLLLNLAKLVPNKAKLEVQVKDKLVQLKQLVQDLKLVLPLLLNLQPNQLNNNVMYVLKVFKVFKLVLESEFQ